MLRKLLMVCLWIIGVSASLFAQKNPREIEQDWNTDKANKRVESLDEFLTLLPRDAILPIDAPQYWSQKEAKKQYFSHEPVIAVEFGGQARAYPLSILMFHEIVNDEIGGQAVTLTYCPLCNAAIAFDRNITFEGNKQRLDFGTSGMLRNSDLVMWDRQTETWWQQFTGEGLVGDMAGAHLEMLPSFQISVADFFERYPAGKILSTETGGDEETQEMYGKNPYVRYDSIGKKPRLFFGEVDNRLPAMERIVNIKVNGKDKIYPWSAIQNAGVINDQFEGESLVLFHTEKTNSVLDKNKIQKGERIGSVTVFLPEIEGKLLTFQKKGKWFIDLETGSKWDITGSCKKGMHAGKNLVPLYYGNHFAFAWFAFHKDSAMYRP